MSLCNSCLLPTALPECEFDGVEECELVKICGVVNQTNVKTLTGSGPSVLYCYRLEVQNCTGSTLCDVQLSLALRWKCSADPAQGVFQQFLSGLNGGAGLYHVSTGSSPNQGVFDITSNIPGATPISADGGWNGEDKTVLFDPVFELPPGKFIVTVCFEVLKSAMPAAGCPLPALFPATADFVSSAPKYSACPILVSTIVGCSPTGVAAPRKGSLSAP